MCIIYIYILNNNNNSIVGRGIWCVLFIYIFLNNNNNSIVGRGIWCEHWMSPLKMSLCLTWVIKLLAFVSHLRVDLLLTTFFYCLLLTTFTSYEKSCIAKLILISMEKNVARFFWKMCLYLFEKRVKFSQKMLLTFLEKMTIFIY